MLTATIDGKINHSLSTATMYFDPDKFDLGHRACTKNVYRLIAMCRFTIHILTANNTLNTTNINNKVSIIT